MMTDLCKKARTLPAWMLAWVLFLLAVAFAAEGELPAAPTPRHEVHFLDAWGDLFLQVEVEEGMPLEMPPFAPDAPEGTAFLCWIAPGAGDDEAPYPFGQPVTGALILLPSYSPLDGGWEPEMDLPAGEDAGELWEEGPAAEVEIGDGMIPPNVENVEEAWTMPELEPQDVESIALEILNPSRSIAIEVEGGGFRPGDWVVLHARLTGYEGIPVALQWQYAQDGQWHDIEGEHGLQYAFALDASRADHLWRVEVTPQ